MSNPKNISPKANANTADIVESFRNNWTPSIQANPNHWGMSYIDCMKDKIVKAIAWNNNEQMLILTEDSTIEFSVTGDCCSKSYFYDFIGVKNLLGNGKIINAEVVALSIEDAEYFKKGILECQIHGNDPDGIRALKVQQALIAMGQDDKTQYMGSSEYIQVYGYRLTTLSRKWGPVSSVFSFRNSSNGYYGGSIDSKQFPVDYFTKQLLKPELRLQILLDDKVGD